LKKEAKNLLAILRQLLHSIAVPMTGKNIFISNKFIYKLEENFHLNPINKIALNAVTNNGISKVGINRNKLLSYPLTFSTEIKTPKITDQKSSGRCWIFAALNSLRIGATKKMNLEDFELSQSYLMFYDKLERANYFLENIIKTLDKNVHSRLLMWLLEHCMEDGGQWSMFTNLVKKYGVVPKEVYPESISSSATNLMNAHISEKLREYAFIIRGHYKNNKSIDKLRELKPQMLEEVHRILSVHNSIPPKKFYWNYTDKNDKFHCSNNEITPIEFYNKFIDLNLDEYVSLINCPTQDKEFNKHYTVDFLSNIVGGKDISYVNVAINIMKEAAIKTLKEGNTVWFGCDVGKDMSMDKGILDKDIFNFDELYNVQFKMAKKDSVEFCNSKMTHAMLITGVHEEDHKIVRWKVENSWGEKRGRKGFFVMGDNWFEKYVYQVVVPKKNININIDISKILKTKAIRLEPWDAMGSLAF
jgi:bleomycin hydrolase